MKEYFNIIKPYLIIVVLFLGISYTYYSPLLEGKVLHQGDITHYKGMSKSLDDHFKESGERSLWLNSAFSGMPAERYAPATGNKINFIRRIIEIGKRPASYLFVCLLSFFILLSVMGVKPWLSTIGAITFGLFTYLFMIIGAGHNAKMLAISYMPLVIAGVYLAFNGKRLTGAALLGIGISLQLSANHIQITYYLMLMTIIYGIFELVDAIRKKTFPDFLKTLAILMIAASLGAASNTQKLWVQKEYSEYTMRGGSDLKGAETPEGKSNQTKGGLDRDYATRWSYGRSETLNLLIPNFRGGSSHGVLTEKSETYKLYSKSAGKAQAKKAIKQMPLYWGGQPFTDGPMYIGAIAIFLFVLGSQLVKGKMKWMLVTVTVFAILLGWGRHLMWFQNLFLDFAPLYNKFRAPATALVLVGFTVPILGLLGLNEIFQKKTSKVETLKALKIALASVGGLCLLFVAIPSLAGDFTSAQDGRMPEQLVQTLMADRKALLVSDAFRSLVLILAAAIAIYLLVMEKAKAKVIIASLVILVLVDMWPVGKRILNNDNFVTPKKLAEPFIQQPVDKEILKDKSYYRVLDLSINTFNDNRCSYYHSAIGGYSAAKLMRYQEMIDYHISREMQAFANGAKKAKTQNDMIKLLSSMDVVNMLNTKYIITNQKGAPIVNPFALGNAWFVQDYKISNNADEEINALYKINPRFTAVVDKSFSDQVKPIKKDPEAKISLTKYKLDELSFESTAKSDQLAVFSDIYHNIGWQAYIDGEPVDHIRVNYILRGLSIPAGKHTIEWKYSSKSFTQGKYISTIASILLYLFLLISILPMEKIKAQLKKRNN